MFRTATRERDGFAVESLERVLQRGPILLLQCSRADLDLQTTSPERSATAFTYAIACSRMRSSASLNTAGASSTGSAGFNDEFRQPETQPQALEGGTSEAAI